MTDAFEAWNDFVATMHARDKESPAKTWFHANLDRAPVYRQLGIDPTDDGAAYAVAPFRVHKIEGQWRILAAYPAPLNFSPDDDWLGITHVLAWEPKSDTAIVLGDETPQTVGSLTEDANVVFASPRAFFQAWAIRRAIFAVERRHALAKSWHVVPVERDLIPGALLIGSPAQVRWSPSLLPETIECVGVDPRELNKAIFRAARLPRVSGRRA